MNRTQERTSEPRRPPRPGWHDVCGAVTGLGEVGEPLRIGGPGRSLVLVQGDRGPRRGGVEAVEDHADADEPFGRDLSDDGWRGVATIVGGRVDQDMDS